MLRFTSLARFNSKWALAFLTPSLHLRQCLSIPPSLLVPHSTSRVPPFYVCVLSRAPPAFAWFPACGDGPFLSLEKVILEKQPGPGPLFSSGLFPMGFFQADAWRRQSVLSWSQWLWSCLLPCSLFSGSWTPPSHRHCNQGCPQPSPSLFVTTRSNTTSPLAGSYIIQSDISWHSADWDFWDKLKEFHTEILGENIFHLCKYSLIKWNKIITHTKLRYTSICQDSEPLYNCFCHNKVESPQKGVVGVVQLLLCLWLWLWKISCPHWSQKTTGHIFFFAPVSFFNKWISVIGWFDVEEKKKALFQRLYLLV